MAQIKKIIKKEKDLTVFTVAGDFEFDQIIEVTEQFYLSEFTLNILWDLSKANLSKITRIQMENIISHLKQYAHVRNGGKTAFVMSDKLHFGLARMFEIISEIKDYPISQNVFETNEEAMRWLEE